jgi:uncharacterized membrane protein
MTTEAPSEEVQQPAPEDPASSAARSGRVRSTVTDWRERFVLQITTAHPAAWLTALGILVFAILFGTLGVQNHQNFGTWSYDMGIYDQAIWLVSRGGNTFMSVRGLDVWGHHVNLIFYAFVPFYWLGAGPSFLYVAQATSLALGAAPVYLIARDKFKNPWMGFVFAVVFLMYAPMQWISWAMFHPEALVITPFLYAWWFASKERWGWFLAMVLLALSTREDTALAVFMLGIVLMVAMRSAPNYRRVVKMSLGVMGLGVVWYFVATKLVIPHFNDGKEPFYITYFYGNYGSTTPQILGNILAHPDRVVHDAVQHDRLLFYKQMSWPVGWTYLANPLGLLMALPQLLASVIGLSPYARMIRYQYTSVMVAPMFIASIHGAYVFWRFKLAKVLLPIWLLGCAYVTNVAWSPSPLNAPNYAVWAQNNPRDASLEQALTYVPANASVSASYELLPHLSHRHHIYDWPNPFTPAVWGNDDCAHLPNPRTIDYVVLDKTQIGDNNMPLYNNMRVGNGPFSVIFEDDNVVVLKRNGTTAEVDVQPQQDSCQQLALRHVAG